MSSKGNGKDGLGYRWSRSPDDGSILVEKRDGTLYRISVKSPKLDWVRWILVTKLYDVDGDPDSAVMNLKLYDHATGRVMHLRELPDPANRLVEEQGKLRKIIERFLVCRERFTKTDERAIKALIGPERNDDLSRINRMKAAKANQVCGWKQDDPDDDVCSGFRQIGQGRWEAYSSLYGISSMAESSDAAEKALIEKVRTYIRDSASKGFVPRDTDGRRISQMQESCAMVNNDIGNAYAIIHDEVRKRPRPRWRWCIVCGLPFKVYRNGGDQKTCPPDISDITEERARRGILPRSHCKIKLDERSRSQPAKRERRRVYIRDYMRRYRKEN